MGLVLLFHSPLARTCQHKDQQSEPGERCTKQSNQAVLLYRKKTTTNTSMFLYIPSGRRCHTWTLFIFGNSGTPWHGPRKFTNCFRNSLWVYMKRESTEFETSQPRATDTVPPLCFTQFSPLLWAGPGAVVMSRRECQLGMELESTQCQS